MDYGAIAAGAAGTAFGVGSVFSSHHDARANRREARRQFNIQTNESIQRRVQDALKAGINPLAALGASVNASPTIHAGGYSGEAEGYSQIGTGLSKALQGLFEEKAADDVEYNKQAQALDLEHQRLQNQYLRNEVSAQTQKPGVDVEPPPSMQGEQLLFTPVYDLKGRPRLVINQNAIEADSDNPGYMSSIMNAIGQAMTNGQISADGRITSSQLRMMLDDFYYQTSGHHIKNLESLYISPTEAATAATMLVRGVS